MRPVQTAVKALLISRSSASNVIADGACMTQFQILNPGAPAAGELQFVGPLGDHLEAHVLEHRQQVGNRNGILVAEDLQEEFVLAPRLGSIDVQVQARGFLLDGLEERHIQGGGVAVKILRVGGGKCLRILVEQLQARRLRRSAPTARP